MKKIRGWWLLALLASVGIGLYGSRRSWELFQARAAESRQVQQRAEAVESELVETEIELARASDPVGRESLARKRGYRKPSETPLVLEP
ncbi:MAG: hypothetical protein KF884_09995 [Fimbriimonadaceae bacterium]|nr:hypothetical protein [Fimbriimonadaceae bacterium]QYK57877.1 MAG: hypothetical protein KF884_09995 [Fimbriimonadaceae bacterium]